MSMQVIEKRVWCFTVSPGPLSILEEDDELDGDFEEDEKADPEDVLGLPERHVERVLADDANRGRHHREG